MQRHLQEARAADGVLDQPKLAARGTLISALKTNPGCLCKARAGTIVRWIGKERVEFDVVVRRIEAGMVEDIKSLDVKSQLETLFNPEVLEQRHIHTGLERTDENIPAGSTKSGFVDVASPRSYGRSRIARRNAESGVAWL